MKRIIYTILFASIVPALILLINFIFGWYVGDWSAVCFLTLFVGLVTYFFPEWE